MLALLRGLKGRGYKTRLINPHDELWDRRLGVQTFGFHPGTGVGKPDWQVHYAPTPYSEIFRLLKLIDLRDDDVFVDLGSGMGRTTFAASWLGAKRAVGVEIVQDLCNKSNENLRRSRLSGRPIKFVCMNAADYRNPDVTVLFMCHPFGEATLRHVMRNFESDVNARPDRTFRIVYRNPMYDAVLQQIPWLECVGRVPPSGPWPSTLARYETTLWRSVPLMDYPQKPPSNK